MASSDVRDVRLAWRRFACRLVPGISLPAAPGRCSRKGHYGLVIAGVIIRARIHKKSEMQPGATRIDLHYLLARAGGVRCCIARGVSAGAAPSRSSKA